MSDVGRRFQRLEVLARVIQAGTDALPWCGNVALQKLVYLLQSVFSVDLGYQYGLHHLGPYSPELADDVGIGESAGRWTTWEESFVTSDGVPAKGRHFVVQPGKPFPKSVIAPAETQWQTIAQRVELACRQVRGMSSRDLELVATLHYLHHVQEVSVSMLPTMLIALKPKFSKEDVEKGLQTLSALEATASRRGA